MPGGLIALVALVVVAVTFWLLRRGAPPPGPTRIVDMPAPEPRAAGLGWLSAPAPAGPPAPPWGVWIRGHATDRHDAMLGSPEHPFIGFVYVDPDAGLSARGGVASKAADSVAERPHGTLRLPLPGFAWSLLDDAGREALGLPVRPAWLERYGPQPDPAAPWRQDPAIGGALHPSFPDDAAFVAFEPGRQPEQMWGRLQRLDDGAFVGRLLNAPRGLTWLREGDEVRLHHAGRGRLVALGPVEMANRQAFDVRCQACGFDVLPLPAHDVAAAQFPDVQAGELMAFTSRCSACGGTMTVARRQGQATAES